MQPRKLAAYLKQRAFEDTALIEFTEVEVTRVEQLGMGDRVCVDMCSSMRPGEGLLVGNFCRALFLVHSEVRLQRPSFNLAFSLCASNEVSS